MRVPGDRAQELEAIAIESKRTIDIDEFVPRMPDRAVSGDQQAREDQLHRINKNTGHRIKYQKIDAVVESPNIIKGYQVGKCEYPEIEPKSWKRSRSRANVRST